MGSSTESLTRMISMYELFFYARRAQKKGFAGKGEQERNRKPMQ